MRKISCLFLMISFFIVSLNFMVYANHKEKNEYTKETPEENQKIKTKANKYKWELSTSMSLGLKIEPWINNSKRSTLLFSIPARIGYFLEKNLEIEPEVNIIFEDLSGPLNLRMLLLANLVYNFNVSSKVTPFILAGAGIMRVPEESNIDSNKWTETFFTKNVGAGVKWFVAKKIAFRSEYRLINYKENADNYTYHKIFFGVSIFF